MASRPAKFVLDQASKTVARPARLFAIAATALLQGEHPAAALLCLRPLLTFGRPTIEEYLLGANCLYQGLGRLSDAVKLLARAGEQSLREAAGLGLADTRYRVLDSVWARHIGHLGIMDYVVKLGILEGRHREDTIFYLPPKSPVANRFLLDQLAARLRLIEDPADLPFPAAAVKPLHFDLFAPRLPGQTASFYWELAGRVHRRWEAEGRPPLLQLPPEIATRGHLALEAAGVPRGAWFVALHVREREPGGRKSGLNAVRNADTSAYFPAIAEIAAQGGWVVRLGDPSMTPLPPLANVVDYCHSPIRADWMDIFILARCRFLIGTNSGPAFVAALYGTPALLTNWWPARERPWHSSDVFVPKLLRRISDGRRLSLGEMLCERFGSYSRRYLAERAGVRVEDNDPEIIRAAVADMLARLAGTLPPDAKATELAARADRIYQSRGIAGMGQLARGFLRNHGDLIA